MILVAVDTSGRHGSVTLARVEETAAERNNQTVNSKRAAPIEILETAVLEGGMFSAQLIPLVAELLERHGVSKNEIGAFAVASGPGSFTGLRVGLAAVKGLAEVLGKPIVAVSLLEAVARASSGGGRKAAALDAGRNEMYVGEYFEGRLAGRELLMGREELVRLAPSRVVTPDPAVAEALRVDGHAVELVAHPGSSGIARLGWEKLNAGERVTPEQLEANYIRRSDAEIFAKK